MDKLITLFKVKKTKIARVRAATAVGGIFFVAALLFLIFIVCKFLWL